MSAVAGLGFSCFTASLHSAYAHHSHHMERVHTAIVLSAVGIVLAVYTAKPNTNRAKNMMPMNNMMLPSFCIAYLMNV